MTHVKCALFLTLLRFTEIYKKTLICRSVSLDCGIPRCLEEHKIVLQILDLFLPSSHKKHQSQGTV